jgi:hypothetical protein
VHRTELVIRHRTPGWLSQARNLLLEQSFDGLLTLGLVDYPGEWLLDLPLLFTAQVPDKLGGTVAELRELAPAAVELAKASFSALADEDIRHAVTEGATEHLILCGLETPVCVYQTALDALNLDLQVTVLTDAVGARRPDDAATVLRALAAHGAHCLPTETVFYALLHDATHPAFKVYTQLVKSAHGH